MTTTLKCGEWRCTNPAMKVNQYVDSRDYHDREEGKPLTATLKGLRCNVHAGAIKRRKYYGNEVFPLTDEDRERLLKEQAAIDAERRAENEKRQAENAVKAEQRRREQWAEMDLPASHSLTEDTDRSVTAREEPIFTGQVWLGEEQPEHRYDYRWLQVEPTQRHYGVVPKGEEYPYVIRVMRGSNLTPNEARELAALLVESADKAEELNAGKAPA